MESFEGFTVLINYSP